MSFFLIFCGRELLVGKSGMDGACVRSAYYSALTLGAS